MNNIKVSVIIPVYNTGKYLHQCLTSIIEQTLNDIEVICVNDGSTDNSLAILQEFANKDKRITIISLPNGGKCRACNTAFKLAIGEYISVIDSDDWVDKNYFETLYNAAIMNNADLARTNIVYELTNKTKKEKKVSKELAKKASKNQDLNLNDNKIHVATAIYKKEYLLNNDIFYMDEDLSTMEDIPFTTRVTVSSSKSVPALGTYYHYRVGENNNLSAVRPKTLEIIFKVHDKTISFLNNSKISKDDYLVVFKRCMARYNRLFKDGMSLKEFDKNAQITYVNNYINDFKLCKYTDDLMEKHSETYFKYLINNDVEGYINFIRNKMKRKLFIAQILKSISFGKKRTKYKMLCEKHKASLN